MSSYLAFFSVNPINTFIYLEYINFMDLIIKNSVDIIMSNLSTNKIERNINEGNIIKDIKNLYKKKKKKQ